MSDFKMISDQELNELLKAKLLESSDNNPMSEKLLELQAKIVFAAPAVSSPVSGKESDLLSKVSVKSAGKFSAAWLLTTVAVITTMVIATVAFVYNTDSKVANKKESLKKFSRAPLRTSPEISIPAKSQIPQTTIEPKISLPTAVLTYVDSTPVSTSTPVAKVSEAQTSATKTATPSLPLAVSETIVPALSPELPPTKEQACRVKKSAVSTPVLFNSIQK